VKTPDRALLAAMAPVLLQIKPVAWAGARASARGSMLYRDGAVARVTVSDKQAMIQVHEADETQRVVLQVHHGSLQADCSCGAAPCAHAVAALHELQKRARAAQESDTAQAGVMAALRQRLSGVREEAPEKTKILSNLERLPLEAGVDMVALAWRQSLRHGPGEVRELTLLVDRLTVDSVKQPHQSRELALRLLHALNARKVVFVPLPEAAENAVIRLVPVVTGALGGPPPPPDALAQLVELALDGQPQVGAHVAAGLDMVSLRDGSFCATLTPLTLDHLRRTDVAWREVSAPTGRDRLLSALVVANLHHERSGEALDCALAWPPMRNALQILTQSLGKAGKYEAIVQVAGHYDPRGDLWSVGVQSAAEAALAAGHVQVAARLTTWAFERQPQANWYDLLAKIGAGPLWPERRAHLVARLLADDDPVWLAERLAIEPDAPQALLHAVLTAPLRERTARDSLGLLRKLDPLAAFHGRCARLMALVRVPGVAARTLKDELTHVDGLSQELGEPGLLRDLGRLLARELGDHAALATAIGAALGPGIR
jgi:hypothetical protein